MEQSPQTQYVPVTPAKTGMSTGVKVLLGCIGCATLLGISLFACSALGLMSLGGVAQQIEKTAQETEQKNADRFGSPKQPNTSVVVKDLEWKVVESKNLGSVIDPEAEFQEACTAVNGSNFIFVKFTVKNNASEGKSLSQLDLVDSQKREFKSYDKIYQCLDTQNREDGEKYFFLDNINPGLEQTYLAYYEVPKDANGLRLKVGDLDLFNSEFDYISLGL